MPDLCGDLQSLVLPGIHDPLSPHESTVYGYMQYLKVHGSPTTAHDVLQAWRFLHHTVGLKSGPVELAMSSRVCGAADGMFSKKRELVQANPLSTKMVLALERIVLAGPYPQLEADCRALPPLLGEQFQVCRFDSS